MKQFKIEASAISGSLSLLFEALPESWITLVNPEHQFVSATQQRIIGHTLNAWNDHELGLLFESTVISLIVSKNGEIQLEAIKAKQTLFPDLHVNWFVNDLETETGTLLFTADELTGYPLKKQDLDKQFFLTETDTINELATFDQFTYEIHLTAFESLDVAHIWRSEAHPELSFDGVFKVDRLRFTGTVGRNPVVVDEELTKWQQIVLDATVNIGKLEANVSFNWDENTDHALRIAPKDEKGSLDFTHVLSAFNLEGMKDSLEAFAKELPILDEIQIRQISAGFQRDSLKLNSIVLFGDLFCFGADFEVRFTYLPDSEFLLSIRLRIGSFFTINDLLGSFPGGKLKLPVDAQVGDLILNAQLDTVEYDFFINIIESWQFSLGSTLLELKSLQLFVAREMDEYQFSLSGIVEIGGVDIELIARKDELTSTGWLFETDIAQQTEIKLQDIITDLGQLFHFPVPEHIPPFTAHNIAVSFDTGSHNFHVELGVSLEKPGIGPFSEGDVFVTIALTKNGNGGHDFQMSLNGWVMVAGTELSVDARDIGRKDWSLDMSWDKQDGEGIDLLQWMRFFTGNEFKPHDDFNKIKPHLEIGQLEFHYRHGGAEAEGQQAADTSFLMNVMIGNDEQTYEGFFSGVKSNTKDNQWDFLIGIGYDHHKNIPDELLHTEHLSTLSLESLWVLVNMSTEPGANWPPLPVTIPLLLTERAPVLGIAVTAAMDIKQQTNVPGAANVFAGLKNSKVMVLAEVSASGLLLEAGVEGDVVIPTGNGSEIVIEKASISLELGVNFSFKLSGVFEMKLDDHNQRLTISLDIDEFGIILIANESNSISTAGWEPFGLKGIHIDQLGLEFGVDFEPPGARIGFEGKVHLDGENENSDELAIVMEFVGPIPNPEYLAIAFNKLRFSSVLALFPGSSSTGHEHILDNLLEVDDFMLVWCEKPVVLPDGTNGRLGFSLHGAVKILDWGAFVSLEVHPETGIQGTGELSPIHIGPLSITGNGKGISVYKKATDSGLETLSNVRVNPNGRTPSHDNRPKAITYPHEVVKAGGLEIAFNSVTSPYLRMSANVALFGMDLADIDIDIENEKAKFDLFFQIPLISKFRVSSTLSKNGDFSFNGDFFLGIALKFDIPFFFGPIHVDIRLGIAASLEFEKTGESFGFSLKGGVVVMNHEYLLADLKIEGIPASLKELPNWILTYIKTGHAPDFTRHIQDGSGANNDDAYSQNRKAAALKLLEHAQKWADFVHRDMEALREEKGLAPDAIQALITKINADTTAINDAGKEQVKAINDAGNTEVKHLQNLINAASTGAAEDANVRRATEMEEMLNDIKWLQDADGSLRKILEDQWDKTRGDEVKMNAFIEKELTPDKYSQRAVDHHLRMIRTRRKALLLEMEIRNNGRNHAKGIRANMTNTRFVPLNNRKDHE